MTAYEKAIMGMNLGEATILEYLWCASDKSFFDKKTFKKLKEQGIEHDDILKVCRLLESNLLLIDCSDQMGYEHFEFTEEMVRDVLMLHGSVKEYRRYLCTKHGLPGGRYD